MPTTEYYVPLWEDFKERAHRLAEGAPPVDAVDTAILYQLEGIRQFCETTTGLEDLQLPELHSGAPWSPDADRPTAIGDRWVAFVALNPGLTEDESFPRLGHLDAQEMEDLIGFFDGRFAPRYRGVPLRRGRHRGRVRLYEERTGTPKASQTWSVLDGLMAEALAGLDVSAPLGDAAAIVDAVPYKFRNWGKAPEKLRKELVRASLERHFGLLGTLMPSAVVLMGKDTHELLDHMPPVGPSPTEPVAGVLSLGLRRLGGTDGAPVQVFACYHPTSRAWSAAGSRRHLAGRLRAHLLGEEGG